MRAATKGTLAQAVIRSMLEEYHSRRFPSDEMGIDRPPPPPPTEGEMARGGWDAPRQWQHRPEGNYRDEIPAHELLQQFLLHHPLDEYDLSDKFTPNYRFADEPVEET